MYRDNKDYQAKMDDRESRVHQERMDKQVYQEKRVQLAQKDHQENRSADGNTCVLVLYGCIMLSHSLSDTHTLSLSLSLSLTHTNYREQKAEKVYPVFPGCLEER